MNELSSKTSETSAESNLEYKGVDQAQLSKLDQFLLEFDEEIEMLEEIDSRPEEWIEDLRDIAQFESEWSDEIIDSIYSQEEFDIYMNAELTEDRVNDRPSLVRSDIDYDQKDSMGNTNLQRMERGLAPLTKEGTPIELHHIGQRADSPLAELTIQEHRGKGNDTILHDKSIESNIDRNAFNIEKADHWKARAEQIREGENA